MKLSGWCKKTSLLLSLFIFLVSFLVYGVTSSRNLVNIADSSELLTAAYGQGVAHPPAYPMYTAFLSLVLRLPDHVNPVFLSHLSSGLFQSLALVFFFLTSAKLTKRRDVSLIGTFALGFSQLFWNQATYAEVFSLLFFFIALLTWLVVSAASPRLIAFLFGIAASHHQLAVLLIPGLIWGHRKKQHISWISCAGVFFIGLCIPYLWLIVANHQAPLSWRVDPGFMGFIDVLLRSIFSGTPVIPVSWFNRIYSIVTLFTYTFSSFNWVISFVALVGIFAIGKLVQSMRQFLLISLVLSGPVLMGYLVFLDPATISLEMHAYNTFLTLRMTLIFQYIFALFIPFGMTWFLERLHKKNILFTIGFVIVLLGSVIFSAVRTYPVINKHDDHFHEQFYAEILSILPHDSVLLVDSDDVFGLLATQTIRGTRRDVLIIPTVMQMRWGYLQQILPTDIFAINGYYKLILSLSQWAEMHNKNLFVYQPKQIFFQQIETYGYVLSPYGYTLKISRSAEHSPTYSYGLTSQLLTSSYSKNDMWSVFERKQLANMHEILAKYYVKNGQIDQSKVQHAFSKQLIDSIPNIF